MKRTLGDRVRTRRSELGLSMEKLADEVGIRYQTIQDLESGKSVGTKHLLPLAKALKVRPEWLQNEQGPMAESAPSIHNGGLIEIDGFAFARLPVYDIRFAAGAGSVNYEEEPIDYHLMSANWLRAMTKAALGQIAIFQADGDSMEPAIHHRDWVLADLTRKKLANPGIYALVFEGEGLLKRVSRHLERGEVTLISDNPKYGPQTIKVPNRLLVVGRVFASIQRH